MDRNALDWIFSTLPQAIAAIVGLIFAGTSFFFERMDLRNPEDDSCRDIYEQMKKDLHESLKELFRLSGFAVAVDIILLFTNPIEEGYRFSFSGSFDWYYLLVIVVIGVNLFVIIGAIHFVLYVTNPSLFANTVKGMADTISKNSSPVHVVPKEKFLNSFIEFERVARTKYKDLIREKDMHEFIPLRGIMEFYRDRNLINHDVYQSFLTVNRIRNVLIHGGDVKEIDASMVACLDDLKDIIETIKTH